MRLREQPCASLSRPVAGLRFRASPRPWTGLVGPADQLFTDKGIRGGGAASCNSTALPTLE
jgi:hypothetical protein